MVIFSIAQCAMHVLANIGNFICVFSCYKGGGWYRLGVYAVLGRLGWAGWHFPLGGTFQRVFVQYWVDRAGWHFPECVGRRLASPSPSHLQTARLFATLRLRLFGDLSITKTHLSSIFNERRMQDC